MCGVTQKSCKVGLPECEGVTPELEENACDNQCANGDKDQGMSEMTVIFEKQQRISAGINEYIQIWRHTRQRTKDGKGPQIFRF